MRKDLFITPTAQPEKIHTSQKNIAIPDWLYQRLFPILIGWGFLVRIIPFLHNRNLWYDEANLATGIITLPFSQLADGLPFDQSAPLFFIYLQKMVVSILGTNEMALRLVPLMAGLLGVVIFAKLVRTLLPYPFAVMALAFFVFNSNLVYFSSEVKQYSLDVLAAVSMGYLTLILLDDIQNKKKWFYLSLLGSLFIWFSQPVVFMLAGVWLALLVRMLHKKETLKNIVLPAICWSISFGLFFYLQILPTLQNTGLVNYHTEYFMPLKFWDAESWRWYGDTFLRILGNPGGFFYKWLALPFALVGIYAIWKKASPAHCLLLVIPFLFAFLASGLGLYSTIPRLLLFTGPAILLWVSFGLFYFYKKIKKWAFTKWIVGLVASLLILQTFLNTAIHNMAKFKREEITTALEDIEKNRQPTDEFYAYAFTDAALRYYLPAYPNCTPTIYGQPLYKDWRKDFSTLKTGQKIWLLFSHYKSEKGREDEIILNYVNKKARQLKKGKDKNVGWYLYEWQ